jgi:hypothetical protein
VNGDWLLANWWLATGGWQTARGIKMNVFKILLVSFWTFQSGPTFYYWKPASRQ